MSRGAVAVFAIQVTLMLMDLSSPYVYPETRLSRSKSITELSAGTGRNRNADREGKEAFLNL